MTGAGLRVAAAAVLTFGLVTSAAAEYPERSIRMIVNFGAGGTTDVIARLLASKVEEQLGGSIAVSNKAGAGGTLGVAEVANGRADGYLIGTANMPSISVIPHLREVPYDPFEDVVQIAAVLPYEYAVLVRGDAPWQTWDELVEHVEENPASITYGSVGTGTTNHLAMARIGLDLGLDWTHVPFQNGVEATSALLGGHIDVINNTLASVVSSLESGDIRALMVTSERRFDLISDVPTMEEKGFDFSQVSYMSIVAPKGIPEDVRAALEDAFAKAVEDPEVREDVARFDATPAFVSGEDYVSMLRAMSDEWGAIIAEIDIEE